MTTRDRCGERGKPVSITHPPAWGPPRGTHGSRRPLEAWLLLLIALCGVLIHRPVSAAPAYRVLGQPALADETLASRCADANARFTFKQDPDFGDLKGPSGIATDHLGRLFVTDFGGGRVLMWASFEALNACQSATVVASGLRGPEAVVFDAASSTLFVADTLTHTVVGYQQAGANWTKKLTLGSGATGSGMNQFHHPRGLAVDGGGRLFVADDDNNRILIFNPGMVSGASAVDSIGAGANGGFNGPKGLAMVGHTLFVADYYKDRVLRFTGPFDTPAETYTATGIFTGVTSPVDLAVHGDGSLLVTDQGNVRIARYADAAFAPGNAIQPSSTFADNMNGEPLGVAADRAGRVYVADYSAYRILIRDEFTKTTPVDPNATAAAKALLADLHSRPGKAGKRVAIGQQLNDFSYEGPNHPAYFYADWLQMEAWGCPLPLIMGGELKNYFSYDNFSPNVNARNKLIEHGQAGKIVTLVWHPQRPSAGGDTPMAAAELEQMVDDNTAVGQAWQTQLNRAAAALQVFEDAGVTVLFRPLHEQNGDFFWWGDNGSRGEERRRRQAAWVAMWRDMVRELTVTKGLHNLVFLFGSNQVNYEGVVPPLSYYPGSAHVDAVGIDLYDEELDMAGSQRGLQHYSALTGTGKPFGLSEIGQSFDGNGTGAGGEQWDANTLVTRINDSYPRMAFAVAWYSSVQDGKPFVFALPDVSNGKAMMQNALIHTQDCGSSTPSVGFLTSSSSGNENSSVSVTVALSEPAAASVSIPYTVSGTAGANDRTVSPASPVTIPQGQTTASIVIAGKGDALDENNETVVLTLGAPAGGAALGTNKVHTRTLNDDDPLPTVSIVNASLARGTSADSATLKEPASFTYPAYPSSVNVRVQLSAPSGRGARVNYLLSGSAKYSIDYSISPAPEFKGTQGYVGSVLIPEGQTSVILSIKTLNDGVGDPNETAVLTLSSPTYATLGAQKTFTVNIAR